MARRRTLDEVTSDREALSQVQEAADRLREASRKLAGREIYVDHAATLLRLARLIRQGIGLHFEEMADELTPQPSKRWRVRERRRLLAPLTEAITALSKEVRHGKA